MPAKDLGTKHVCYKCGTRFYDLKKPEPICPKCGADQRQSPAVKAPAEKRSRAPAKPPAPAPAPEPEVEAADAEGDDDAESEDDDEDDDDE
jgi:predicted  nucleic acid-binding Zn-ribbon protein